MKSFVAGKMKRGRGSTNISGKASSRSAKEFSVKMLHKKNTNLER